VSALFVAVVAAAVVVPLPAAAHCKQAGEANCCCPCHHRTSNDTSSRCHRSAELGTCVSRTCDCRQTPEPQNVPPERTTIQAPTGPVVLLPADAMQFHGGVEFASTLETAHNGHLAAIPHRILHCSWLV
jgi:hypothetical protein